MNCANCKYLKEDKKIEGAVSGSYYYYSKMESFVSGSQNICDKFEKTYSRKTDECNKLYNDGKDFYNDATPIVFYVIILIVLIILGIIFNIFTF